MKHLLNRLLGRNKLETVETSYSQAVSQPQPLHHHIEAERLIVEGNTLEDAGQPAAAEVHYRKALELQPNFARAALNTGNALSAQGKLQEAVISYQDALRLEPGYGAAHANLGKIYLDHGRCQQAVEHYAAAVQALPHSADALAGLGCAMEELQRYSEALEVYHRALAIQPDFAGVKLNLGRTLILLNQPDAAVDYLEEALAGMPDNGLIYALIGQAMGNLCLTQQAVLYQRRALELNAPKEALLAHILLFNLNHVPDCTPEALFTAHRDYAQRYCSMLYPQNLKYKNTPDPGRRLKIGYVSGDFREHPVSRFIEPVFAHHDPANFEVHAFYNYYLHDEVTARLKDLVTGWHSIWNKDDAAVADLIGSFEIDILIDLSGHTENQRLLVFARKPAPVQAAWLGYLGTTGLATMDYRICDAYTDPPDLTERFHTEKLMRLPACQWCHMPYADLPPVSQSPFVRNGYLTLGSFNKATKLNDQVLGLWAEILNAIPKSRLIIASVPKGRTEEYFAAILEKAGVARNRFEFMSRIAYRDYLASLTTVDIALDPFPYNGGTTTLDTLVMGVPLVTLAGDHSIARGGVSLLSNLGLTELIADTAQDYLEIVRQLAEDPARLAALRGSLRERVLTSSLMDGPRFTHHLETLYRQMWHGWCASKVESL